MNEQVNLYLEQISSEATEPLRATDGSACYDLSADLIMRDIKVWGIGDGTISVDDELYLSPGERALIPTGWKMCCDQGYRIAIYPRSGLSIKHGISLINCVGVIDSDYRDEVMLTVVNHGKKKFKIKHGDRLAQFAVEPVQLVRREIGKLPPTQSNRDGGFGSTGV